MPLRLALAALSVAVPLLAGAALAHDPSVTVGPLTVSAGWARAMLPGQPTGGAYFTIANSGAEPDRLVSAESVLAGRVEIHEMKVENDVMVMRPLPDGLEIPAGGTVELKPGGYHLMFMEVARPFVPGGTVPLTLRFQKAGAVSLDLPVRNGPGEHSAH